MRRQFVSRMTHASIGAFLLMLAGCASNGVSEFCKGYGLEPGSAEFPNCRSYYHQMEAAFSNNLHACEYAADAVYPKALYAPYANIGVQHCTANACIDTSNDYEVIRQRQLVQQLRNQIIEPCMLDKGWNSSHTWQAGRKDDALHYQPQLSGTPRPETHALPWIK